jgi:hypothetical protein
VVPSTKELDDALVGDLLDLSGKSSSSHFLLSSVYYRSGLSVSKSNMIDPRDIQAEVSESDEQVSLCLYLLSVSMRSATSHGERSGIKSVFPIAGASGMRVAAYRRQTLSPMSGYVSISTPSIRSHVQSMHHGSNAQADLRPFHPPLQLYPPVEASYVLAVGTSLHPPEGPGL